MRKRAILANIGFLSLLSFLLFASFACNKVERESLDELGFNSVISFNINYLVDTGGKTKAKMQLNETIIRDVNIYIFNSKGDIVTHKYSSGSSNFNDIEIWSGEKYSIWVLANVGYSLPKSRVEQVQDIAINIPSVNNIGGVDNSVILSGFKEHVVLYNGATIGVDLVRNLVKITLKGDVSGLNADVTLTPISAKICNVASIITPFKSFASSIGEVIEGEELTGGEFSLFSSSGCSFYALENMQGIVAPSSLNNKQKVLNMSSGSRAKSTYLELVCNLESGSKSGVIKYRFYPGEGYADCNLERNNHYIINVLFKGNASEDENSWSVDTEDLEDKVTINEIEFANSSEILYVGEERLIPFSKYSPLWALCDVAVNNSHLEILEKSVSGIRVKAISAGSAYLNASILGSLSTICNITIEPLRVVINNNMPLKLYDGFDNSFTYTITPAHAAHLPLLFNVKSSVNSTISFLESNTAKVRVDARAVEQNGLSLGLNIFDSGVIECSFVDYPEIKANQNFTVVPAVSLDKKSMTFLIAPTETLRNNLNHSSDNVYTSYQFIYDSYPEATLEWKLLGKEGLLSLNNSGFLTLNDYGKSAECNSYETCYTSIVEAKIYSPVRGSYIRANCNIDYRKECNVYTLYSNYASGPYVEDGGYLMQPMFIQDEPVLTGIDYIEIYGVSLHFSSGYFTFYNLTVQSDMYLETIGYWPMYQDTPSAVNVIKKEIDGTNNCRYFMVSAVP